MRKLDYYDYPFNYDELPPEAKKALDKAIELEENLWWRIGHWWMWVTLRFRWWWNDMLRKYFNKRKGE